MWQNIIVFTILGIALFFVLRRVWRTAKNSSQPGCGCTGCSGCSSGSNVKSEQGILDNYDPIACPGNDEQKTES